MNPKGLLQNGPFFIKSSLGIRIKPDGFVNIRAKSMRNFVILQDVDFKCNLDYNQNMERYNLALDIQRIITYFDISIEQFADEIGLSRMQLYRLSNKLDLPSKSTLEKIYSYPYLHGIDLNKGKSALYMDNARDRKLLFHGTEADIKGQIDVDHSVPPNDFGNGFYAGETLPQAATWVANKDYASVYCFYARVDNLRAMTFYADRRWLYAILFYRNAFQGYDVPKEVHSLIEEIETSDIIIAPIADNEVYQTIQAFANSEITDEACIHAISASNLGNQYVFKNNDACKKLVFIDRLFLCTPEKAEYIVKKKALGKEGIEKANLAKIEYRREGKYFDELFKRQG